MAPRSSQRVPELEDSTERQPAACAPATVARSPSGWIARCMAVGAIAIGEETGWPSRVVPRSGVRSPRRTRGRNLTSDQARVASPTVTSPYEPLSR